MIHALISALFFFALIPLYGSTSKTANLDKGIILQGYDPVSYFSSAKPLKGDAKVSFETEGITYHFANEANRSEFVKDSKKFTPAYEGWCATAVAGGYKYDIDPLNYKITDGRLYLFYKGWKGDAKKEWVKSETESIKKADANWPKVREMKE